MATEKRLIDAHALIDEIDGIYQRHYINSAYQFIHDFFRAVFRRIHKAPTVDAVEVVRCKDCRHYVWDEFDGCYICLHICKYVKPNFGCVDGERKDNEKQT